MAEVTKEDISKVHERLDALVEGQAQSRVAITRIETTLKLMPQPPARPCPEQKELRRDFDEHIKNRPCPDQKELRREFNGHVRAHTEARQLWQRPIVAAVIHLLELALVAAVTYGIVRMNGG